MVIVSLGGGWILLVAGMKAHELIMGLVSVSASAFFLCQVKRAETLKLRFGAADVAAGWRVPGYLAMDIWVITIGAGAGSFADRAARVALPSVEL